METLHFFYLLLLLSFSYNTAGLSSSVSPPPSPPFATDGDSLLPRDVQDGNLSTSSSSIISISADASFSPAAGHGSPALATFKASVQKYPALRHNVTTLPSTSRPSLLSLPPVPSAEASTPTLFPASTLLLPPCPWFSSRHAPELSWSFNDIAGILLISLSCAIAVTVGVGGGGLFVPIMILVMGFTAHEAAALSQSLMAGGTLSALFLNLFYTRHPHKTSKPVLDAQLTLLLGPVQISGALVGVVMNRMLPSWIILLCMICVLFYSSIVTLNRIRKNTCNSPPPVPDITSLSTAATSPPSPAPTSSSGASTPPSVSSQGSKHPVPFIPEEASSSSPEYFSERMLALSGTSVASDAPPPAIVAAPTPTAGLREGLLGSWSPPADPQPDEAVEAQRRLNTAIKLYGEGREVFYESSEEGGTSPCEASTHSEEMNRSVQDYRKRFYEKRTFWSWIILVVVWISNFGLLLVRGGSAKHGLVEYCGGAYWLLGAVGVLVLVGCSVADVSYTIRRRSGLRSFRTDTPSHRMMLESVDLLTPSYGQALILLGQTFGAGFFAGMLGIGGGMLLGPLLLAKGIHPLITTAVNATLVLLTSSAAAASYIINGRASIEYALVLGGACFIAALLGKACLDRQVMTRNLSSHLVYLLVFVIVSSMVAMIASGVMELQRNGFTGFQPPC